MIQSSGPQEDPDINFVWAWFEFQIELLGDSWARVVRRFKPGDFTHDALRPHENRFIGLTRVEVDEFFEQQRGRLELLTMFELLATTEATLRTDFNARVSSRKKDSLSRRFRVVNKTSGGRVSLEKILDAMKDEGARASVVADFRGVLRLRNWLAHGRYWHPRLGRGYTPSDVFDISRNLVQTIVASG